jgi:hypothetical protein
MARVWRDGQKRRVFEYRFFGTGSIEEKVFQRQLSKEGLQGGLFDAELAVQRCVLANRSWGMPACSSILLALRVGRVLADVPCVPRPTTGLPAHMTAYRLMT